MLPDRVSNPGSLTYESGALPIALRGPAFGNEMFDGHVSVSNKVCRSQMWPRGYKTFFMLNSIQHENFPAHKC